MIVRPARYISLLLLLAAPALADQSSRTVSLYRQFAKGEIADVAGVHQCAKAVVGGAYVNGAITGGTEVTTQNDVRTRWEDGSLKGAQLSFTPASIATAGTGVVFKSAACPANTGQLTLGAGGTVLSTFSDFDVRITATDASGGNSHTVSARQMVSDSSCTYWMQGPSVTYLVCK